MNVNTGLTREASNDTRGSYLFTNLQPGTHKVTVTPKGFQPMVELDVVVGPNEVRRVDFHVQLQQSTQSVEVKADAVVLQTDKADVHDEIGQTHRRTPINGTEGRNFQSLLYLVPGAGIPAAPEANSDAGNPQRAMTLFMNGPSPDLQTAPRSMARPFPTHPWLPVNIAYVPPVEAIEVVNITTNVLDAEQGAAGGAAINVQIKSGTNSFHGAMFELNQNNDMTAVNYFSHSAPLNKNIFNQYGFGIRRTWSGFRRSTTGATNSSSSSITRAPGVVNTLRIPI